MKILISCFACGPNWGSEVGMGWRWITNLSKYCELSIITEKGFQSEIEEALLKLKIKHLPNFYYIDIGESGRNLFWKQGSFSFYRYYRKWQLKAYSLALEIIKKENIDIIHQLNMIGFREPGYLWKIKNIPFVWGPVGGFNQFPWSYINMLKRKNYLYYSIKNIINKTQIKFLSRYKLCAQRADVVFAATLESQYELNKISRVKPILLNETGCNYKKIELIEKQNNKDLNLLWVGKIQGLKALPIALKSLSMIQNVVDFTLTIIGDGPDEKECKNLAKKLGINGKCIWKGRISNIEVIQIMRKSDVLLFTSVKEGTPHVVTESIENGLPVICHDSCGQGAVITNQCGIKIPMIDFNQSISGFSEAIKYLFDNRALLNKLSDGALQRSSEITWESKALFMLDTYKKIINKYV